MDFSTANIPEVVQALQSGQIATAEYQLFYQSPFEERQRSTRAFQHYQWPAQAASETQDNAPLANIPIAIKDCLNTVDMPTTACSRMLAEFLPIQDATVVQRLRRAGAMIVGKTNMDEFAMGSSTENSAFGPSRNPWNLTHVPGGSSGGSAAAVAAEMAPLALGSDTGGSIRQPAAFCGVTGLKPTYGRVSRSGLIAFASSLDQIGPIARSARDAAVAMEVIAGHDPQDSTSIDHPVPKYSQLLSESLQGLKVGICREQMDAEWTEGGLDPQVRQAVMEAAEDLQTAGAELSEVSLPHTRFAIAAYYVIAPCEASSNLARYDGVRYTARVHRDNLEQMYSATRSQLFGDEVKRRILLGTYALSSGYYDQYYLTASKVRTLIKQDYDRALETVDVILGPTTPTTAFQLGERTRDPVQMYLADVYTVSANLAGVPAISIPCGFSAGLPIGLQLQAKPFAEALLLRVAHQYQLRTDWHLRRPNDG